MGDGNYIRIKNHSTAIKLWPCGLVNRNLANTVFVAGPPPVLIASPCDIAGIEFCIAESDRIST